MSRISYRSHVSLKYIKDGKLSDFPCYNEDQLDLEQKADNLNFLFSKMAYYFGQNVCCVSENFLEASMLSRDKLEKIILTDINTDDGILYGGSLILKNHLYSYDIRMYKNEVTIIIFEFYKNGALRNVISGNKLSFCSKIDNALALELGDGYSIFISKIILTILYFKKYAQVEILESKAKTKTNFAGCKYLNETDLDIEYLDSKWFTTLVNSQGFKVRGFFRLQPKKKDGEWTKELIWINEFEKHGYNRQAKILNDKPL